MAEEIDALLLERERVERFRASPAELPWGPLLTHSKESRYNCLMATATVTSKGQVTIPIEVRQKLGIRAGTRLEFVEGRDGGFELYAKTGSVTALAGMFSYSGPTVSIDEMDDAIAAAAVERYDRTSGDAP